MRLLSKCLTLTLTVVLLSGCNNYEAMQNEVIKNNERVETVLTSYEQAKATGSEVEEAISSNLQTKDSANVEELDSLSDAVINTRVSYGVNSFIEEIHNYIDYRNKLSQETNQTDEIPDIPEFITSSVEVHYFVDGFTGKTEQMFLVQLPNGFVGTLSIFWLGGNVIDAKTSGIS